MGKVQTVHTSTSRQLKNKRIDELTVYPPNWFIHDYFMYVKLAWTTLVIHVGDIKPDLSKPMKIKLEIPIK